MAVTVSRRVSRRVELASVPDGAPETRLERFVNAARRALEVEEETDARAVVSVAKVAALFRSIFSLVVWYLL